MLAPERSAEAIEAEKMVLDTVRKLRSMRPVNIRRISVNCSRATISLAYRSRRSTVVWAAS